MLTANPDAHNRLILGALAGTSVYVVFSFWVEHITGNDRRDVLTGSELSKRFRKLAWMTKAFPLAELSYSVAAFLWLVLGIETWEKHGASWWIAALAGFWFPSGYEAVGAVFEAFTGVYAEWFQFGPRYRYYVEQNSSKASGLRIAAFTITFVALGVAIWRW